MEGILYRDHRGMFEDSIKTIRRFTSMVDLKAHIQHVFPFVHEPFWIIFEHYGKDERVWGETYLVKVRFFSEEFVAGMSNGVLEE